MKTELLRGRYEPLEVVGQGGEGRVLRALDRQHDRVVALKIRPALVRTARDELLREARVLLSLDPHPGLPLVRDDFFRDDDYVIVMDWIEGVDLERLLREEGTPGLAPSTVLGHLAQVAEALTYLHGHDPAVVHGDVKPANLILTSGGRVVLVDFGLASTGDRDGRAGSPGYVAPEVAAGEPSTRSSDIFSLAMTAFTLLTGSPPRGGAPEWPPGLDAERRRVFEEAIRRGAATDPSRRPASAGELVERLRAGWEADVPTGVVTVCMTDIEGSTGLWEAHPHAMGAAIVRHDAIIAQVVEARGGRLLQSMGEGDSTVSVFTGAGDAVRAAPEIVERISEEPWPDGLTIRTRVGLHTGETSSRGGDRLGPTAARAARVRGLADGGQVFLSRTTAGLVEGQLPEGFGLVDLGPHTLRGFTDRENVFALSAPTLRAPPSPALCPYRGLLAFEAENHDMFFGREEVLGDLLGRLGSNRFVAVVGASGSGKSSLVRAGVIAAIQQGELAGVSNALLITPGANPGGGLRGSGASDHDLLVVDQFEEVFTLCQEESERTRFFEELLACRGTVLIVLRADFYGHCAAHEGLAQRLSANNVLLGPMTEDEMHRAVVSPAEAGGFRLEPGLVELVLRDATGEPGALPLLSHALMETWARRDGRTLTLAGYRDAGGVTGAIARTAEEVYGRRTEDERDLMRRVLLSLTELGEATEDTRRRVPLSELAAGPESAPAIAELIDTLTTARLLTLDEGSAQVAHEALIREWPRLRGWLNEDREGLMVHRHLTRSASAWEAIGRDSGELYRGARLAAALDWARGRVDLTAGERAFLEASGASQERELREARRRARRLWALLAVVAAALVAAVIAGAFALVQRGSARHTATVAQAGRLAAQSREVASQHPDLGLLLALEAGTLDDSVDTRGALFGALEHGSRIRAWLQGFGAPVVVSGFSPNGRLLATVTIEETTLWDTTTWKPVGPPLRSSHGGWEEGVAFSPDGRTLAIANGDGEIELWDVSGLKKRRELADPGAARDLPALSVVRYSPDGRVIASGAKETNHVTLWDAATGRVIGRPIVTNPPGSGGAQSVSFSPDSERIAVPGAPGTVGIWDVATGRRVGKPLTIGSADVEEAIFTKDGGTLIASDDSGAVTMVDVGTGRPIRPPFSVGDKPAASLDLSPDGRLVGAASFEGSVFVWDVKTGVPFGLPLAADTSPVNDVAFSPDGRTLVSSHGSSAVVWSMSGEQAIGKPLGGPRTLITDVAFSPDGRRLVAGRFDGSSVVYDSATRRQALRIEGGSVVTAVAFHPGGNLIAIGTIDGEVRFFDPDTGATVGSPLDAGRAALWQVAFSPDGVLAVAVDPNGVGGFYGQQRDGQVRFWDVDSRRRVGRAIAPGAGSVLALGFNRDGSLLATGSLRGQLDLWDVSTQGRHGSPMRVTDDAVLSVAFDPSGRLVAAGGAIGPVRVWRVSDQQPAFPPLSGHTGQVTGAAFDLTGSLLATTTLFGETRLWDAATGLAYGELVGSAKPDSLVPSIDLPGLPLGNAFSPDGKLLAVAGVETRAMLWDVDPEVWRERACAIVGRNLSIEEWRLYLPSGTPYRATCSEWPTS